jgi:LAO/AO transport system kinase
MAVDVAKLVQEAEDRSGRVRQRRAGARLMTLLESDPQRLAELFGALPQERWPRPRLVLGVTGAPGSGKSTLVDALITEFREASPTRRLGVVAVDPSSPYTGGAVLGDRVRMMRHAEDENVFIRSMASRGHLGGLSLGVRGVIRVMGLIGCDVVIVETVGVGQSEVEIATVADQVVVVLAPGQGDSIQMLKAGLLEIADVFVINKADVPGADQLQQALLNTLSLRPLAEEDDSEAPPVLLAVATERQGISEVVRLLESRTGEDHANWQHRRDGLVVEEVREAVLEQARRRLLEAMGSNGTALDGVMNGDESVEDLTRRLLQRAGQIE